MNTTTPSEENIIKFNENLNRSITLFHNSVEEMIRIENRLLQAERDIAALIWLNGNCEYCKYGKKDEYSGASIWRCSLGDGPECKPEWRGVDAE